MATCSKITVALAADVSDDYALAIESAIRLFAGVAGVTREAAGDELLARMQVSHALRMKLYEAIRDALDGSRKARE